MQWTITHGDILDVPADVLVCSANVFLNLSGGVGGAILFRYGEAMQKELHGILAHRQRRFVDRGEVIQISPCGTPYKALLHAVAVDALYESSPQTSSRLPSKPVGFLGRLLGRTATIPTRRMHATASSRAWSANVGSEGQE